MYNVRCTLLDVQCTLYTLYTIYSIRRTSYNVHCTVYTVSRGYTRRTHYTLHNMDISYIVYSLQYALFTIHCTGYNLHHTRTLHRVHYTAYTRYIFTVRHTMYDITRLCDTIIATIYVDDICVIFHYVVIIWCRMTLMCHVTS